VPGVFLWNGQAVPLFDLSHCLGFKTKSDVEKLPRTVVGKIHGELLGFCVDELSEVAFISLTELTAPRVHELRFALAEVEREQGVSTVLDLSKLVAHVMHIKSAP
jgi:chemotaxis signal transduction protein